jgi:tetratricopeptide (TPR) repeat protein
MTSGLPSQEVARLREALKRDPKDLQALTELVRWLASPEPEVSDPEAALELLSKAIEEHPESALLRRALGGAHAEGRGDYRAAYTAYREAAGLDPEDHLALFALGSLYQSPGVKMSLEEATHSLERAASLAPWDWQVRRGLAGLLWRAGNLRDAKEQYEAALPPPPPPDRASGNQIRAWLAELEASSSFDKGYFKVLARPRA